MSYRNSIRGIAIAMALLAIGRSAALAQATGARTGPDIWDTNLDGVYTCDEWRGYLDRAFVSVDRNHDGNLDPREFENIRKAGDVLATAEFGYFDENQDGKISRKEFVGKPSEFILHYDRNGDCRVTPDEIRATDAPKGPPGPTVRPRDVFH